jgi:hypothetical protein
MQALRSAALTFANLCALFCLVLGIVGVGVSVIGAGFGLPVNEVVYVLLASLIALSVGYPLGRRLGVA